MVYIYIIAYSCILHDLQNIPRQEGASVSYVFDAPRV